MDMEVLVDVAASLSPRTHAFFFDFDGTLARIVDDPAAAGVSPDVRDNIRQLSVLAGGALAIVSGRSTSQLHAMLQPLHLPLSGIHGQQLRNIDGSVEDIPYDEDVHAALVLRAREFAHDKDGVIVEVKPGSVAIHFRRAPFWAASVEKLGETLCASYPRVHLLHGKMVLELKIGARTKGDALDVFMSRAPFKGRQPIFFGDDVTDEHAFDAIARMGGTSFKIGGGSTAADYRFGDIDMFHNWLANYCHALAEREALPPLPPPANEVAPASGETAGSPAS